MYETPEMLREFLALCLDPGPGRAKRTPEDLTRILPEPILGQLTRFDPQLGALRAYADQRQRQADAARLMWAAQLAAWITGEAPGDVPAPTPAAEEGETCVHESWEVTSEYQDPATGWWVKSRRCADCRESLSNTAQPEPHFDEHRDSTRAAAAAAGHATVEETTAAYLGDEGQATAAPAVYLTPDGRVWTYQGERVASDGPALYESPSSPKAYTVPQLKVMYGWVAIVDAAEGKTPAEGEGVPTAFEDYARVCRDDRLVPFTTAFVRSGSLEDAVHAAVHVSLDPRLELDTAAIDEARTAICDGLAFRGE